MRRSELLVALLAVATATLTVSAATGAVAAAGVATDSASAGESRVASAESASSGDPLTSASARSSDRTSKYSSKRLLDRSSNRSSDQSSNRSSDQSSNRSSPSPRIDAVFPSPRAAGDDGETILLAVPEPISGAEWRLLDDAGHEARLPNRTLSGTVAVSPEPEAADSHSRHGHDGEVLPVDGRLRLTDSGDRIALRAPNGTVVDRVAYERARDGQRYVRTERGWRWRRSDRTTFEPVRSEHSDATAFVLPDSPAVPVRALRSADERILLAGYTLTSTRVADALVDANRVGVDVAVVLEGAPVGGTSRAEVEALDRLVEGGVDVTVLAGAPERYATHHPKYAVVDDRALVLTENWKPAGTGGASSRGWGVLLRDDALAAALADVFHADATGESARSWSDARSSIDPVEPDRARGSYPERFSPRDVEVETARLLLAPDNAERELLELLGAANESIRIQQVSISGPDDPLLAAVLDAARRGVAVEIVLDSAWYVREENQELRDELDRIADREGLAVSVELVDPGSAFAKSHVKGVIVDERRVVLGSLNWNPTALRENREVLVVLEGEGVANYYGRVFAADRGAQGSRGLSAGPSAALPIGLAGAIVGAWLTFAVLVATRVRWL